MRTTHLLSAGLLLVVILGMFGVARAQDQQAAEAAPPAAIRLPQDTLFAVTILDAASLREQWNTHRLAEAWRSPEVARLRSSVEKMFGELSEELIEEAQLDVPALLGFLEGPVAFCISNLHYEADSEETHVDPALVARVSAGRQEELRAKIEEILAAKIPADAKKSAEEFHGSTIYHIEFVEVVECSGWEPGHWDPDNPDFSSGTVSTHTHETPYHVQYGFHGDHVIVAEGNGEPVKKLISLMADGSVPSLAESAEHRRLTAEVAQEGDLAIWVNVPALIDYAQRHLWDEEARRAMDSLGIVGAGGFLLTMDLRPEGIFTRSALRMPREKKGLVAMLYAGSVNSMQTAEYVPSDATEYWSLTADVGAIWREARLLVRQLNPQGDAFLTTALSGLEQTLGANVETDVVEKIGGEHAYFTRPVSTASTPSDDEMPSQPSVTMIALRDGATTVQTIDSILTKLSGEPFFFPIESMSQEGMKIWKMREDAGAPVGQQLALALTPSHLVLSPDVGGLQDCVRRLRGEGEGSLAGTEEFRAGAARINRENLRFVQFTSTGSYEYAAEALRAMVEYDMFEMDWDLEAEDIPPASWWRRYFGTQVQSIRLGAEFLRLDGDVQVAR